ncbi:MULTISPECIES: DUF2510 domain-containing protein [unclassified Microbacterium]|uniref:DUF2510 domain-containing protein n=1 Tax=unclassified Microbacterium TaxID=2609290 RepID=UPI0030174EBA
MSMPAGWYDDGSGRQRWWDGARWTDHFAPGQAAGPAVPAPGAAVTGAPLATTPRSPVLGFVGLGLAALGTVLACIPLLFGIGVAVLLAGFVVSLIGLFMKGAAKWPSIVGLILSVAGGAIGTIVLVVTLLVNAPGLIDSALPTNNPPSAPAEGSDPPADASGNRPSPAEIGAAAQEINRANGLTTYDDMPDFYPCVGQYVYDSELSDDSVELLVAGAEPLASERELAVQVIGDATLTCDPQG